MDYQQRAYYDAMRRSQEASMRRSQEQQYQQQQQRASAPSNPYSGGGGYGQQRRPGDGYSYQQQYTPGTSRDSRDSRDSRGSRGSSDGLRMSGGAEMAGVGIFFQQEPNTGKVYVANIVQGGSADRSGVIRVNDVIVKVDDEDVQGQPLSTLRNLILGKQGSYVVLAFRRMTGTELYYFDVELVRGSPEYFESLKKSQAIADEKDKLINQVRQQEAEIQKLKQDGNIIRTSASSQSSQATRAAPPPPPGDDSAQRELMEKNRELRALEDKLKAAREDAGNASSMGVDAAEAVRKLQSENARLNDTLQAAKISIDTIEKRLQGDQDTWNDEVRRLETRLKELQSGTKTSSSNAEAENQRLKREVALRKQRAEEASRKLPSITAGLEAAVVAQEDSANLLNEIIPSVDSLHSQIFATFRGR